MIEAEDINNYFASISNLASKVVLDCEIVKQSCIRNGLWDGLSVEQQEAYLDRFMIDQTDQADNEAPSCFPVWKINSGEKFVFDFEHEDVSIDKLSCKFCNSFELNQDYIYYWC
jgi:Domain of unknown function (DUF4706)